MLAQEKESTSTDRKSQERPHKGGNTGVVLKHE